MDREIFEVYAKIVDANGTYNTLTGYPKVYDSRRYDGSIERAQRRAEGAWHDVMGVMSSREDRQKQIAMVIRVSDGAQIMVGGYGAIVPDPDPAPVEEPAEGTTTEDGEQ